MSRCTYRMHFKELIPVDAPPSSQVSFILGFGSSPKFAELVVTI